MGMKSFPVTLSDGRKLGLRLTLGGQKAMQRLDPTASVLANILGAMDSPDAMAELLTQCLNWKGNDNVITDGEDLYNALVDDGWAGNEDFGRLVLDLCRGSGLLQACDVERVKRIISKGSRVVSRMLEEAAADEPIPEDQEDQAPAQEVAADPLGLPTLDG